MRLQRVQTMNLFGRGQNLAKAQIGAIARDFPSSLSFDQGTLRYATAASVWGRWFVCLVIAFQFVYRPDFWYYGHFEYTFLLAPLIAFNGLAHYRLLAKGWISWRSLLLLSAMDVAVATVGIVFQGGFDGFVFVAYYPALALFVAVFTSIRLGLAWTTMTAGVYIFVCLKVGPGLDIVAGHEKELLVRIEAMYCLTLCVGLITRLERIRREAVVERELAHQQEQIRFSQTIHDTAAQSAYMIGLGIDAARQVARDSNQELIARLQATSLLSKTTIWQLRHPIDMGRIYDGRELGRTLGAHVATFTSITSVPAEFSQNGAE